jgi:hypothetical protein
MRISDGSSTPTPAASNDPPQNQDEAFTRAMAAASAKTQSSSSRTHTSPSNGTRPVVDNLGTRTNLRGYAFNDQNSVFVKKNGDFELGRASSFNYVSPDLKVTATQSSSLKVKTVTPEEKPKGESESTESTVSKGEKPKGEKESTENTDEDDKSNPFLAKTNLNLIGAQGSTGASAWSKTFSNNHAYLTESALGVEAWGQARVGINLHDGISAQASGSVSAYLVDAQAGVHGGPASVSGEASVGANASGDTQLAFNPMKGDVGLNAGVSANAGAQANETGSVGIDGTDVSETAGVGVGVGIDGKLDVGMDNGDIGVKFDVGGYLGIGANVDVSFNVNVPKVVDDGLHDLTEPPKLLDEGWHDLTSIL